MAATLGLLTIAPPQNASATWQVPVDDVQFEFQLQYAATSSLTILTGWETYYDESDADSPIQLNGRVLYSENGVYIFRGTIFSITRTIADGVPGIIVDCLDDLYVEKHTYCVDANGSYIMRDQTPLQAITAERLYQGAQYTGLQYQYIYYPQYDSDAWMVSTAFVIIDNLGGGTGDIAAVKVGATSAGGYPGIPPAAFFKTVVAGNTEFMQYNGLQYNQADGFWYCLNVRRAKLGSFITNPAANATANLMLSKRIACEGQVLIEGTCASDTVDTPIPDRHYQINYEDGSFVFGLDPLDLRGGTGFTYMQASYSVYNEDGGSELLLSDVAATVLGGASASGGPGLAAGALSIALSPDPVMARYVVEEPTTVDDFFRRVLFELGLNKGDSNLIGHFYNSADGKIHLDSLVQKAAGSPDRRYYGERNRSEDVCIDDVASAVIAWYNDGGGVNLANGTRFWHRQTSRAASPWLFQKVGGDWAIAEANPASWYNGTYYRGRCLLNDNDSNTGFGIGFDADPTSYGSPDTMFYAWFPGASDTVPATWYVNKISVTMELAGGNAAEGTIAGPMKVAVKKIDDFAYVNATTEPTGTHTDISPSLTQIYAVPAADLTPPDSNYPIPIKQNIMTLQADGLCIPTKAICIDFATLILDAGLSNKFAFKILDIYIEGIQQHGELMKLASAYSATATDLLIAPLSYAKIHDAATPQHHVQVLDIGTATREVAMSLAWLQLLQTLALSQTRVYVIDSTSLESEGIPIVGETLEMSDGFAGLCDNVRYQVSSGGVRSLEVRLINYLTTLFGMSV
jgi:hypothetical protein